MAEPGAAPWIGALGIIVGSFVTIGLQKFLNRPKEAQDAQDKFSDQLVEAWQVANGRIKDLESRNVELDKENAILRATVEKNAHQIETLTRQVAKLEAMVDLLGKQRTGT